MPKSLMVTGIPEIDKALEDFTKDMKKVLRRNMRKQMRSVQANIQNDFPKDTGETAASFKIRAAKKTKRGTIKIEVRSQDDNYIATFIEYGTVDADGNQRIKPHGVIRREYELNADDHAAKVVEQSKKDAKQIITSKGLQQ